MTRPARRPRRTPSATDEMSRKGSFIAVFLVAAAVVVFLYLVHAILLPFAIAGAVAYIFMPAVDWLTARARLPRLAAALLVFALLLAIFALAGYLVLPSLLQSVLPILADFQAVLQTLLERFLGSGPIQLLGQPITASQIAASAADGLRGYFQDGGNLVTLASWSFIGLFGFFLTWTLIAYFLAGAHRVARGFLWLFPPHWRARTGRILLRLHPILRRYFIGIAIVITYACIAAYIGLGFVLGLHHAAFLALMTGFLEVVPVIGPYVSAVVAGLVAVAHAKSLWSILAYVIYATVLRLSIDQLVGPIVLGQAARVHPTLIIFCFLSGGLLFGIAGILLAIPVALAIKVTLATIYGEPLTGEPKKISRQSE